MPTFQAFPPRKPRSPERCSSATPRSSGFNRSKPLSPLRGHKPPRADTGDERGATAPLSGNRTSQTVGGASYTYTVSGSSNRVTSISTTPPKTYSFDANGSTLGDGSNSFGYDPRGRLSQAQTAAGTTTYQIDALGQRIRKSSSTEDTVYHYDRGGHVIAESSPTGITQREYLYLNDLPLAVIQ